MYNTERRTVKKNIYIYNFKKTVKESSTVPTDLSKGGV